MKLKSIILNILLISFISFFFLTFGIINNFMKPALLEIEKKYVLEQFQRSEKIINEDLESLETLVLDWAVWDDTYAFIKNEDPAFIDSNIVPSTFSTANVSFISLFDKNKNQIYSVIYDTENDSISNFSNYFINKIKEKEQDTFLQFDKNINKVVTISYSEIFDSDKEKPYNGYLMMGRILDESMYDKISDRAGAIISFDSQSFNISSAKTKDVTLKINKTNIEAKRTFGDFKNSNLILKLESKRWIGIIILKLLNKTLFVSFILVLVLFIILSLCLYYFAVKKIENLKNQVEGLPLNNFENKLKVRGSGEFSDLATSINEMIMKIQNINTKVLLGKEKYETLFEETTSIHIIVDEDYCIKETNRKLESLLGFNKNDIIGSNILNFFNSKYTNKIKETIDNIFIGNPAEEIQVSLEDINGNTKYLIITPSNFLLVEEEDEYRILLVGNDITEKKKIERKLKDFATLDELTGIYNRRIGLEMLDKNLFLAKRNKWNLIVAFIDVNGLKQINDTLGHIYGDDLIAATAEILKKSIRKSDIVCRLGGDEFLVILSDCDWINVDDFWNRVLANKKDINDSNQFKFKISLSRGFTSLSENSEFTTSKMIELADERMYQDKLSRKAQRKVEIE